MAEPSALVQLDAQVIARHPDGHRIVGRVTGFGEVGVILDCGLALRSQFLSYERGWSVEPAPDPTPPAPTLSTLARGGLGHCCFAGCTVVNCRWCGKSRCVHDFHTCAPVTTAPVATNDSSIAQNANLDQSCGDRS